MFEIVLNDILWIDVRRCENNFREAVVKKAESRERSPSAVELGDALFTYFVLHILRKKIFVRRVATVLSSLPKRHQRGGIQSRGKY